jgi:hypothetical protein
MVFFSIGFKKTANDISLAKDYLLWKKLEHAQYALTVAQRSLIGFLAMKQL